MLFAGCSRGSLPVTPRCSSRLDCTRRVSPGSPRCHLHTPSCGGAPKRWLVPHGAAETHGAGDPTLPRGPLDPSGSPLESIPAQSRMDEERLGNGTSIFCTWSLPILLHCPMDSGHRCGVCIWPPRPPFGHCCHAAGPTGSHPLQPCPSGACNDPAATLCCLNPARLRFTCRSSPPVRRSGFQPTAAPGRGPVPHRPTSVGRWQAIQHSSPISLAI